MPKSLPRSAAFIIDTVAIGLVAWAGVTLWAIHPALTILTALAAISFTGLSAIVFRQQQKIAELADLLNHSLSLLADFQKANEETIKRTGRHVSALDRALTRLNGQVASLVHDLDDGK